jgi:hypothetical protein
MALIDINKELSRISASKPASSSTPSSSQAARRPADQYFFPDDHTESSLVDGVLKLLNDSNTEVMNMAVTWSATFRRTFALGRYPDDSVAGLTKRPRPASLTLIVNTLLNGIASPKEEQRDICCLGEQIHVPV